ncbi:hypothetical protein OUZ56_009697 [Daphnia magna]|uniref:Uncharacterized protein n=1 Tax=Daphnia magna TaxID=35525 RepID=A0ABR0AGQ0_9CRUS|nr:hypothetical protein OUZ56_009697 [Daphnia magna]
MDAKAAIYGLEKLLRTGITYSAMNCNVPLEREQQNRGIHTEENSYRALDVVSALGIEDRAVLEEFRRPPDYGGSDCDDKLATAVTAGFLLLVIEEREICVACREGLRHTDNQDPQANAVNALNDCLNCGGLNIPSKEFVQRMWTIYRFVEFALKKLHNTRKTREDLISFLTPHIAVKLDLSEPSPHQKRSTRSTVSLKTAKLLQLGLKNSKTIRKPKSFKWQDIKTSISNSLSLLARPIYWLRQSPYTSDFENDSEKPPHALLQGSSPQFSSSLPVVNDPKITFTIQPTATEINKVESQEPLPSPNSSDFKFYMTLLNSLNEYQRVETTDICEARAVINPSCQLPTGFPITCRTFTASPICTQESLTIQANFTGSRTKLSDSAIKINQPLSPTIRPETVKTIAQPIALARRNSLPSKTTVRPHTTLTAVVSNNYLNLCDHLTDYTEHTLKNQTATLKFLNEANRYIHFIKTLTPAKTQSSRKKQHPIPHGILRHLSLGLVGKICTAHSTTFINDFLPIPTAAPGQTCSRSRPHPPTSFKSPLTSGKPSGSSGSNTKHGTIHGTAAKSPHQTRRPAHFNANVIIRQHKSVTQDYKEVKRLLQERFHGNENQDFFQTQLEEVKRHPGEAILDYGFHLKNIFEHGYPKGEDNTKTNETTRLQMLRQKFLQRLDKTLRNKVCYKHFTTYEAFIFTKFCILTLKKVSNEVEDDSLCASGPSGSSKRLRSSILTDDTQEKDLEGRDLQIVHHNQPALVTVYKDPETQQEKVFILISVPGGSTEVEFSLVGNGPGSSTARIKHSWPPVMFDIDSLFAKVSIRNEKISQFHPKIVALKNELENNRDSVDAIPQAVIEIPLPIPVQTAKASHQFIGLVINEEVEEHLKMRHFTHFEALDDLYLLPLSSPQSSRSCRGREDLPPIFVFHQLRKLFNDLFLQN